MSPPETKAKFPVIKRTPVTVIFCAPVVVSAKFPMPSTFQSKGAPVPTVIAPVPDAIGLKVPTLKRSKSPRVIWKSPAAPKRPKLLFGVVRRMKEPGAVT